MEGKLYKSPNGEHYYLTVDGKIFAEIGGHPLKTINQSLSLKNCQAIENGYDLDELVKERFGEAFWHDGDKYFKEGFKKALELLGDKKFSEEDMKETMLNTLEMTAYQVEQFRKDNNYHMATDIIQSLQQNCWDVEILMGTNYRHIDCVDMGDLVKSKIVKDDEAPMLDKDGCLILKRI